MGSLLRGMARMLVRSAVRSAIAGAAVGAVRELVLRRNEQRFGSERTPYGPT